jgi:NTE family protein
MGTALVLGGGGITGIAWEVGVVAALRRAGVDLTTAGVIVGTSAGSLVGALIATGVDPDAAVDAQRDGAAEREFAVDYALVIRAFSVLFDASLDPREARARIGAMALAAEVGDEQAHVDAFAARLPYHDWPERRLVVTAVDAETGEFVAWDKDSGVPLVRAVAASCAVPCVFPPVTVNGRRYMDGGVRSGTNADLAGDADRVVVLAPLAAVSPLGAPAAELDALRAHASVLLVGADEAALTAFGPNPLDRTRRVAALDAGLVQGTSTVDAARAVWPA